MRIIHTLDEMTETARGWLAGGSVGFVPTMGYLHQGHISLVEAARKECEISVVSIFVNPLQFATREEFAHYPRDLTRDIPLLRTAQVDVVFAPREEDFYPPDFCTLVTLSGPLSERLEGAHNTEYMRGMATATTKLLQLVRPDIAYFGQKDIQQFTVVRRLVRDLNIDVHLRSMPTVRESDGLALSSRNHRLLPNERKAASVLYRALLHGKSLIEGGELNPAVVEHAMFALVTLEPSISLSYVAVCRSDTFEPVQQIMPGTMLAIAASIGGIRMIDNIVWSRDDHWVL
ncbi:MAG: pantoate--beta-alanine ligase [Ktedonobacteraceae bacterium]